MLEDAVEILAPANGTQRIGVGQIGEYSNFVTVFKLRTDSHDMK